MKAKDILKTLGASEDLQQKAESEELSEDDIKKFHEKNFVHRETAPYDEDIKKHFVGQLTGKFNSTLKKKFGVEIDEGEKWEDAVDKAASQMSHKQKELENKLEQQKKQGDDKKVKELSEDIEKLKNDKQAFEQENKTLKQQVDETKNEYEQRMKKLQVDNDLNNIKSQLPFRSERSNVEKRGFEATIKENYKFDYEQPDENSDPKLVVRQADGKPVTINNQPVYDPKTVIEHVAAEEGQLAKNSGNGSGNGNGNATPAKKFGPGSNKNDKKPTKSEGFAEYLQQQYSQKK